MPGRYVAIAGGFITLCVSSSLAWAADADGNFVIKGAGTVSCEVFTAARAARDERFTSIAGWLDGYLTGVNELREKTVDLAPWQHTELLLSALDSWCRKRPNDTVHTASFRLVESLLATRLAERSTLVAIENDDAVPVHLHAAVIERIQQRLTQRGLFAGAASGQFDDATREALRQFQRQRKLPVTGMPDQVTLANLL